ncbi:hypothetical protein [Paenibacillus sp. MMO-177]|uniref:hypothetical protein n=1 Tax=Paenibacillus sp. MMO-177 TaxID=3081289 RepID=UPI0030159047
MSTEDSAGGVLENNKPQKLSKAYKMSPGLKEKLEKFATEGKFDTQEEFLEHLALLYELQLLKEGSGQGYAKQIDELEYHIRRPLEIFISMIQTEAAEKHQLIQKYDEKLEDRADIIFNQEREIAEQKKLIKEQSDELGRLQKEITSNNKIADQLEATVHDKATLVDEYKEKNDMLAGLVKEYKDAAEGSKGLSQELEQLKRAFDKQGERVASLEGELRALNQLKEEQLKNVLERHQDELERLKERKELEKERDLLALRSEYQGKLEVTQTEATAKMRELFEQRDELRKFLVDAEIRIRDTEAALQKERDSHKVENSEES